MRRDARSLWSIWEQRPKGHKEMPDFQLLLLKGICLQFVLLINMLSFPLLLLQALVVAFLLVKLGYHVILLYLSSGSLRGSI